MKRKLKLKPFVVILVVIILMLLVGIFVKKIIDDINYKKTYEYKFITMGYSMDDFKKIDKLSNSSKDYLLTIKYNKSIVDLINEKYFLEKNLKIYIEYSKDSEYDLHNIIAVINVGSNNEFYTNTKKTDISKGITMLTNKFYYLDSSYNEENMVKVSKQYSYGENQMLTSDTFDAFLSMFNAAKKDNITLIINSSFRNYEDQEEIYDYYKRVKGVEEANKIAAKPGHSEHQTGLAVDIQTYGSRADTFDQSDAFKWLSENAYKYGFILRYPKDKKYITGYEYESWHYRYVGAEVAKYIHENNITFDEYYAYFIEK